MITRPISKAIFTEVSKHKIFLFLFYFFQTKRIMNAAKKTNSLNNSLDQFAMKSCSSVAWTQRLHNNMFPTLTAWSEYTMHFTKVHEHTNQ